MPGPLATRRILSQRPAVAPPAAGSGPSAWPSLKVWVEADGANVFTNDNGTGTVTNGTEVGYIAGLGGTPNFVNATSSQRPTWNSTNKSLVGGSTFRLASASSQSFTGALTIYAVGRRSNLSTWYPLSAVSDASTVVIYSDNVCYIAPVSGTVSVNYTGSTGLILVRFRRDSGDQWKLAATGMSEANVGSPLSGTFTAHAIVGRPNAGEWSHETSEFNCVVAGDGDAVNSGHDAAIRSYLVAKYSVTDIP